jgi:two-component system, NtrC family, response regulator AtoC
MDQGGGVVNILLADDDKNFGLILKREMEEDSHVVDLVMDGVEAVLQFMDKPYSFALLDLKMPKLGGIDAIRILRKINPNVPVMAISGSAGSWEIAESMRCGAVKFLSKPFHMAQLKTDMRALRSFTEPGADAIAGPPIGE